MSIKKAVAVVLTHQDQLLMVKRSVDLRDFPGYWAFPGGKVEQGEDLREACVREAREELGVELDPAKLNSVLTFTTPDFNPVRFETHFFEVELETKLDPVACSEFEQVYWASRDYFVDLYEKGQALMVPPIRAILKREHPSTTAFSAIPYIENLKGVVQVMPLTPTLPPATRTNAFVIGDMVLDPAAKDEEESDRLIEVLRNFNVKKIFLTHHHGDHRKHTNRVARLMGVEMLMSANTKQYILKKEGQSFFDSISIQIVKEGDEVTSWLGKPVYVVEVPGHDNGQLALTPKDGAWFIAGDLFQGVGTVVVGGEESDMSLYMQSLQKVIDLKPAVIFPSHGIGLGGTKVLQKTLEHRLIREKQVLDLFQAGLSSEQMLDKIYFDLPANLRPYAKANIDSHLFKLRKDGLIN